MKKIIYSLAILGAAMLTSCDPLEDVNNELNSDAIAGTDYIQATETYTFTDDDYALYETELDSESYFPSQDVADQIIPGFLSDKYPVWGEGSLLNVTYNLYSSTTVETVTVSETLSNLSDIDGYLASNYESAANGTFAEITYDATVLAYTLSDEDFETIGNALSSSYPEAAESAANYSNFDRREDNSAYWSDDMILEGLEVLLGDAYSVGQVVSVTFAIYDGGTNWSESFTIQHNGYGFLKLDVEADASTGTEYTLTGTDYDDIVAALSATYPDATESMASYSNFERRDYDDAYWSDDMVLEALNVVLPVGVEGDVYVVTYDIYNGSSGTETMTLIYESGVYVANETTVQVESVVAKNEGEWVFPYIFTDADYTLLGQSYGNFDSSSIYKLDIFLESLFPYAAAEDTVAVIYEYYDGSTNEKYGVSVFDGDNWNLTAEVMETTFQYGYEDGEWVPDNTISYTLLSSDYQYIAFALEGDSEFDGLLDTLINYNDYDYNWTNDQIIYSLGVLADNLYPNAEEGQKIQFTYLVYDNGLNTVVSTIILTDGEWIEVE